jgi:hypothetical protein
MIDLQPCAACDRHVSSTEPACPFCGAAVAPAPPRPGVRRGLSRAVLFASATLATAAACGGKAKPDPTTPDPTTPAATADAGVDAAPAQPPDPDLDRRRRDGPPNMPYGAPAARRRLV